MLKMLTLYVEGDQMVKYIKENKWLIVLVGFVVINIGAILYNHQIKNTKMTLQGESLTSSYVIDDKDRTSQDRELRLVEEMEDKGADKGETSTLAAEASSQLQVVQEVPVYICGEVERPGVYYVPTDAIIKEVVDRGGGFTEEANQMAVNLASQIIPNEKIIVPKIGEEIDKSTDSYDNRERIESTSVLPQTHTTHAEVIHLNTATKEQLMTLSGIGEVKAEAIIAYREEKGMFDSIEELKNISGIGEKTFEKIKQFITT